MAAPPSTHTVAVGGGRVVTVDDVGDPEGTPVLYLHGTPDSRLARHPDDGIAAAAGVRLLAIDRPGYGGSSPLDPAGSRSPEWPATMSQDVATLLDELAIERCGVLAWSGGALSGVALAATVPARVAALGIVAGLVPCEAYTDPDLRAGADPWRLDLVEQAATVSPGELGAEVAPLLAPWPCDLDLAAEHQAAHRSATDAAELAGVPGGVDRMAEALTEAVRPGLAGVAADVEAQARPLGVHPAAVICPVHLWYGTLDAVAPPANGRWYAAHLPAASLHLVEGAGHYLAFTHWAEMLATLSTSTTG